MYPCGPVYDNPLPQSAISSTSGTKNLASGIWKTERSYWVLIIEVKPGNFLMIYSMLTGTTLPLVCIAYRKKLGGNKDFSDAQEKFDVNFDTAYSIIIDPCYES